MSKEIEVQNRENKNVVIETMGGDVRKVQIRVVDPACLPP